MFNDPLFLQTKSKIESWRKVKKHIMEPIPEEIKKDISKLAQIYPIRKIGTAFKLGQCSQRYLNHKAVKIPKKQKKVAQFVELSPQLQKMTTDQKKIELDLPMGMTLRIFL